MSEQSDRIREAMHYEFDCAIDELITDESTPDKPKITMEIAPHLVEQLREERAA